MSAPDIVRRWVAEREGYLEAASKGLAEQAPQSVAVGSWNGSATDWADLKREANVLRFLARELDSDAEVEAARLAAGPPPLSRLDAQAAIGEVLIGHTGSPDELLADAILDALGWPA